MGNDKTDWGVMAVIITVGFVEQLILYKEPSLVKTPMIKILVKKQEKFSHL